MPNWTHAQIAARRKIARDLCKRFPETGNRTLAKKLHAEHPMYFATLESARNMVREIRGAHGVEHRKKASDKSQFRPCRKPGELPPLPKSESKPWLPFILEARRVLVLSDIHIPYMDDDALELALAYGDKFKPDAVLLNGDVFDFYQGSRFDKDPTVPKMRHELACGKQFFRHLRARYRKARLYFKLGNHDERLEKYLQINAPELFDIPEIRFAWHIAAGIAENDITVVGDGRKVMLGKLTVLHGHELPKGMSSPVNPARGAFLRTTANILHGHGHRTSEHNERTMDGELICCRTTGCLCSLEPEYARVNKWDHGFATVEVDADGGYEVELKRIIAGKVR